MSITPQFQINVIFLLLVSIYILSRSRPVFFLWALGQNQTLGPFSSQVDAPSTEPHELGPNEES